MSGICEVGLRFSEEAPCSSLIVVSQRVSTRSRPKPLAYWQAGHGKPTVLQMAERASKAKGLTDVDLNYPDHLGPDAKATGQAIRDLGLAVNGLAMRLLLKSGLQDRRLHQSRSGGPARGH